MKRSWQGEDEEEDESIGSGLDGDVEDILVAVEDVVSDLKSLVLEIKQLLEKLTSN